MSFTDRTSSPWAKAPCYWTGTSGGTGVHLTEEARDTSSGRGAVPVDHFDEQFAADAPALARYDRASLLEMRWCPTTLCGRVWAVMLGGEDGPVAYDETASAPTCRRCLGSMDRRLSGRSPDDRVELVAELTAEVVIGQRGFAEVHEVPGDQQEALRKAIRRRIRQLTKASVRTYSLNETIYVVCEKIRGQHSRELDREAAEAMEAVLLGRSPRPRERPWIIHWMTWSVG